MERDKGTPQLRVSDQLNVILIQIYPHSVASNDVTRLEMLREVPVIDVTCSVAEITIILYR